MPEYGLAIVAAAIAFRIVVGSDVLGNLPGKELRALGIAAKGEPVPELYVRGQQFHGGTQVVHAAVVIFLGYFFRVQTFLVEIGLFGRIIEECEVSLGCPDAGG